MKLKRNWGLNFLAALGFAAPFGFGALYVWSVFAKGSLAPSLYIVGAVLAVNAGLIIAVALSRYIPICRLTASEETEHGV